MHTPFRLLRTSPLLLAALAACTDRSPVGVQPPAPGEGGARMQLRCTADVRASTIDCAPDATAGGASLNLVVGGQGTNVRLSNANTAYDAGTGIFQTDVTVQNLLAQPMGTPDGSTVTGVKVFFESDAEATGGNGTISLTNADGTGTFTRSEPQAYFHYNEILEGHGTSQPRTWRWNVPASVSSFRFSVLVESQLPVEDGALRWVRERGLLAGTNDILSVWGSSANNVFAVGKQGTVLRWDGTRWSGVTTPAAGHVTAVWGTSATNVYAVGNGGFVLRYDGNRWTEMRPAAAVGEEYPQAIWGTSASDIWMAGVRLDASENQNKLLMHYDGSSWTEVPTGSDPAGYYAGVWGTGPDDVYVSGRAYGASGPAYGVVMHFDGTSWTESATVGQGIMTGIWGTGASDVYVTGREYNAATSVYDGVILHWNGSAWARTTSAAPGLSRSLFSVWGTSPGNVFAVGHDVDVNESVSRAVILHWTGSAWSETLFAGEDGAADVWVAPTGEAFAVGGTGLVMQRPGDTWSISMTGRQEVNEQMLYGVWGSGAGSVFAVGGGSGEGGPASSLVLRYDGSAWTEMASGAVGLRAVAGTSASNVYAAGWREYDDGSGATPTVERFNGTTWTRETLSYTGSGSGVKLYGTFRGLWVAPGGAGYAVGSGYDVSTGTIQGMLFRTTGNGTWTRATSIPAAGRTLNGIWASSESHLLVVGESESGAIILRWNGSWSETVLPGTAPGGDGSPARALNAVWGTSATSAWAVGDRGLLAHFDGTAWTVVDLGISQSLHAVWGTGPDDVYAAGDLGVLLHFNGSAWTRVNSGSSATLYGGWGSSVSDVFAVGDGRVILHGMR